MRPGRANTLFAAGLAAALVSAGKVRAAEAPAPEDHAGHLGHLGEGHSGHQGHGASDPHAAHRAAASAPPADASAVRVEVVDAPLLDQDGRRVRFKSDVVGDRVVVMDFVYTTCTTICPVLSAIFGSLQDKLGTRQGKDVWMVSLSVDPLRDTPERLKAYSARHRARPGWTWLTGKKEDVDRVLRGLDAYTANFEDHAPVVIVGDGRTGVFARFNGFPDQRRILAKVDELLAARATRASAGKE